MHFARHPENAGVWGPERHPQGALVAREISKSYGPTIANDQVSIAIAGGEITGLVGENGAGKSTLLSILSGFLRPDSGSLEVDGQPVSFASPADSLAAGVGLVHQHLSLVPSFTVREQLALAGWHADSLPDLLVASFRADERIEDLPMGRRQRVEIARALVGDPRILLLDEPTSLLAPSEVEELFDTLRALRASGVTIVIVTHKVREVMTLADRVVAMAQGKVTGEFERRDEAWASGIEDEILQRMFASVDPDSDADRVSIDVGRSTAVNWPEDTQVLRLESVRAAARPGSHRLDDIGFDLAPGRLHAIVGVAGQGQTELAETIAGYRPAQGAIELAGEPIHRLPAIDRARRGIALLLDDRLGEAAVGPMSIAENLALKRPRPPALQRAGLWRQAELDRWATSVIDAWGIQPANPRARFATLSGGNMQRVLAAREIDREPRVLLALNPVHGLDARTAALLWRHLHALCGRGNAVLVFTTDLDEALAESDRCAIIFDGRVSAMEAVDPSARSGYATMMANGW